MPSRVDILDAYRELMDSSVLDFARKMFPYMNGGADYIVADFHRKICEKLDAVVRGECSRLIINVPPRYGKCVHPDTRIYTERGLVAAKDIKAGDMLYSYLDGKCVLRRCVAVGNARKYTVIVIMQSGIQFVCSTDHPILTDSGGYVEAAKLTAGDGVIVKKMDFDKRPGYCGDDFCIDTVRNVVLSGIESLIDIEVEETHNFIGNGLVSHNTQLVSQLFCGHSFAVNPASKILHLSYSAGLTMENSMAVKEMVESDFFRALFPARINPKRNWRNKWDTMQKGGFYATSTLGQITGFGAGQLDPRDAGREEELLDEYTTVGGEGYSGAIVIDDPIKPEEALSERVRETVNRRFETTIRNRVNSKRTPIIIIMQRLHEHDLCGYLMDVEPGKWEVLSLPAIQHDENGDEKALWDFKHTLEELHALREINPWVFDTQYDQNPKPIEGLLFPEKETKYMEKIPDEYELCFIQIDPADEGTNKYCSRVFLVREGYLYNVETIYTEKELEETLPRQKEQILRWHPSYVNAESNSAWRLVAKDLKEWAEGLSLDCDIHRFNARTNKEVRVFNEAPTIRHRFYYLPPSMQDAEYRQSMKDKHSYLKMVKDQDDDSVDCDAAASSWAKKMGLIPLM